MNYGKDRQSQIMSVKKCCKKRIIANFTEMIKILQVEMFHFASVAAITSAGSSLVSRTNEPDIDRHRDLNARTR